jgi:prevent-host-death family protein
MTIAAATMTNKGFDRMLVAAQRAPVLIKKKGQPVAVVVSKEEYDVLQLIKFEKLQADIQMGLEQLERGEGRPAEEVFVRLEKLSASRRKAASRKAS